MLVLAQGKLNRDMESREKWLLFIIAHMIPTALSPDSPDSSLGEQTLESPLRFTASPICSRGMTSRVTVLQSLTHEAAFRYDTVTPCTARHSFYGDTLLNHGTNHFPF